MVSVYQSPIRQSRYYIGRSSSPDPAFYPRNKKNAIIIDLRSKEIIIPNYHNKNKLIKKLNLIYVGSIIRNIAHRYRYPEEFNEYAKVICLGVPISRVLRKFLYNI